jgi:putative tricarboxylic transport membrane protein
MNHRQEIGTGLFFLVLAVLYLAGSLSISSFDPFGNSPLSSRAIPQLIGGLMAVLSVIHIAANALKLKKARTSNETGRETGAAGKRRFGLDRSSRLMLLSVLFICVYIFLFTRLGFILSTVSFLLAEIFLLIPAEKRKRWTVFVLCFSAGLPVLLYLFFTRVLSMFLPSGLLG